MFFFSTYSFSNILLINMDYNKSWLSSLSKTVSAVCVCSPLHPFPAHLSSTKGSCHGDCTRFGGSRSVIPNKSFTHVHFFAFLCQTAHTLVKGVLRERRRLFSAPQQEPESHHKHSSARLIFVGLQRCFARRADNHRPTFLHLSKARSTSVTLSPLSYSSSSKSAPMQQLQQ